MTTQRRRMLVTIICAAAVLAGVAGVAAQETRERVTRAEGQSFTFVTGGGGGATVAGQGDNTFVFVSSEMSIDGKVIKGAPYSAQAVTETVQTLAGGNRIVRRNTANVYRDGEGRTRREQTIGAVGAYAASGEPRRTVFINDPVARVKYILEDKSRTARLSSMGLPPKKWMTEGSKAEGVTIEHHQKADAEMHVQIARSGVVVAAGSIGGGPVAFGVPFKTEINSKNTRKESLGKQTIEGVEAEGTRSTTTIPPGEIGNEQPIEIVSEKWYSTDLQTVVMTRHSDPRIGETTYRLTNISRSEPAHSLFEVPSDYTIQETVAPGMRYKIESELRKPGIEKKDQ